MTWWQSVLSAVLVAVLVLGWRIDRFVSGLPLVGVVVDELLEYDYLADSQIARQLRCPVFYVSWVARTRENVLEERRRVVAVVDASGLDVVWESPGVSGSVKLGGGVSQIGGFFTADAGRSVGCVVGGQRLLAVSGGVPVAGFAELVDCLIQQESEVGPNG